MSKKQESSKHAGLDHNGVHKAVLDKKPWQQSSPARQKGNIILFFFYLGKMHCFLSLFDNDIGNSYYPSNIYTNKYFSLYYKNTIIYSESAFKFVLDKKGLEAFHVKINTTTDFSNL